MDEHLLKNVYFDTCVYHQPGIDLLTKVIPVENIVFATELLGAVRDIDPLIGRYYDDTGHYIENSFSLTADDRRRIYFDNALRIYPRLAGHIAMPLDSATGSVG